MKISKQQATALAVLDSVVPIHPRTLRTVFFINRQTLAALERGGLARVIYYHEKTGNGDILSHGVPFWHRTQAGDEYMRKVRRA